MKAILVVAVCAVLAGCASVNRAMSYNYTPTPVAMEDDTYRVFDHPSENVIMTTTSIGTAMGQGAVRGATFGLAPVRTPEQRHEAAARKHLDETGRSECRIISGYLLMEPQYEFRYECAASS